MFLCLSDISLIPNPQQLAVIAWAATRVIIVVIQRTPHSRVGAGGLPLPPRHLEGVPPSHLTSKQQGHQGHEAKQTDRARAPRDAKRDRVGMNSHTAVAAPRTTTSGEKKSAGLRDRMASRART